MRKKIVLSSVVIVVAALIGAGVWWLFNTGRLVYVSSGTKAQVTSVVCGTDIVDTYNKSAYLEVRNGSSEPVVDTNGMKSLITQIKDKTGYEADATCQTLLFWIAFYNNDYNSAKTAHVALTDLHNKGSFPDSNIRSAAPLYSYDTYLTSLSGGDGQGGN